MPKVFDVAAYILEKKGQMTAMKLQKLVYYAQAWSLVWDEEPLFEEEIQAWANGPVVPELFHYHRGSFKVSSIPPGSSRELNQVQKETIDAILDYYGDKSSQWLSDLTHMEDPWRNARRSCSPGARSTNVITHADLANYYGTLPPDDFTA